jgi:hypothetical protein
MLDFPYHRAIQQQVDAYDSQGFVPFMSERELETLLSKAGSLNFITEAHKHALLALHRIARSTVIEGAQTERLFTQVENDARAYMTPQQYARLEATFLNPVRAHIYKRTKELNEVAYAEVMGHMQQLSVGLTRTEPKRETFLDGFFTTFMGGAFNRKP